MTNPLSRARRVASLCIVALGLATASANAQDAPGDLASSAFRTRGVMTGVSDSSSPGGYKVYSAIAMEGNLTFALSRSVSL